MARVAEISARVRGRVQRRATIAAMPVSPLPLAGRARPSPDAGAARSRARRPHDPVRRRAGVLRATRTADRRGVRRPRRGGGEVVARGLGTRRGACPRRRFRRCSVWLEEPAPLASAPSASIARLGAHAIPGVRIPRSGAVLEALVPAILEQKVTGEEARRAYPGLVRVHGEPAPGPPEWGLRLPPRP